ncbi:Disease resistance protein RGA2 [Bienertia sinuspersici]
MAELGFAAAQTLFATLQLPELRKVCSIWGYKSQLADLQKTVSTIKNVLLDAETKVLTIEAQGYIDELKDAVYDADDLFDEFVTLLKLKQPDESLSKGGRLYQKVCNFFSSDKNKFSLAYRMHHKVSKIQKKLDSIVDNHQKFRLGVDYKPSIMRPEETYSYVNVEEIVGRDDDKKAVIEKLLESKNQGVHFLSVVGVGGQGKTALAQLVFNDDKLTQEFGDSRYWVCVSDQDQQEFDVKVILSKILESIFGRAPSYASTMETVQKVFQQSIRKKYLLVLDDVWNEDRGKWVELENFLKIGQEGTRVLVTTRSDMTGTIIGEGLTYELQGLSSEKSWHLFEMAAFNNGHNQQAINKNEMVEIGKKIVAKCNNNPLAIKVLGSLLFGQDICKWRSFEENGLAEIHNGYIEPLDGCQSIEDAAEKHFSILLQRCFFQNVIKDGYNNVLTFKIHDLMHDVAQEVGGTEIQIWSHDMKIFGDKTRHLFFCDGKYPEISYVGKKSPYGEHYNDELKNLGTLTNLTGRIVIEVGGNYRKVERMKDMSGGYLNKMKHLEEVEIRFAKGCVEHEVVLEKLKPHGNLKGLILEGYNGTTIPRWERVEEKDNLGISLTNLVNIEISNCEELVNLPSFSKLFFLKSLELENLCKVEHMEEISSSNSSHAESTFFPSLERLYIVGLEKLKGWFWGDGLLDVDYKLRKKFQFPCLSELHIYECPNLTSFPPCSSVKDMAICNVKIASQIVMKTMGNEDESHNIVESCASSMQNLKISNCEPLYRLPREIKHLTALESLDLCSIRQLNFSEDDDEDIMPWKPLHQTLNSLNFRDLDITNLPKGMQYLTCLKTLKLEGCVNLKALPEWIGCLSSLQSLSLTGSPALTSLPQGIQNLTSLRKLKIHNCHSVGLRCMEPNGEDWPKIQSIPNKEIWESPKRKKDTKLLKYCQVSILIFTF